MKKTLFTQNSSEGLPVLLAHSVWNARWLTANRLAENGKALQECKVDIARASVAAIYEGFTGTGCIAREADLPKKTNSTLWVKSVTQ